VNRLVLVTLPALFGATSCTVVLEPGETQCETAKDCEARGFSGAECTDNVCVQVDPVWGCLGHVVEPVPDETKEVEFSFRLTFASDKGPVTTATLDICDKLDLQCAVMSPHVPKGLSPDADGMVSLHVRQGFDGFLRVKGPEVMDSRIFVGRPILTPPTVKEVRLIRPQEYTYLVGFANEEVDSTRGTAILLGVDCQFLPVSGVRFESPNMDAKSKDFYLINQLPTSPPAATETDVDGFGGILNMAVGSAIVRSYRADDEVYIGEATFHILASTLSYVQVAPTPQ
jgi:hypothetical protein